jgi:hypothetical protein
LSSAPEIAGDLSDEPTHVAAAGRVSLRPGILGPRPSERRRRWRIGALVAVGLGVGLVLALVARGWLSAPSADPVAAPSANVVASVAVAAPSVASAVTPATAATASAPVPSVTRTHARMSAVPTPSKPRVRCDPPYVVDRTTGIKRYKPECF